MYIKTSVHNEFYLLYILGFFNIIKMNNFESYEKANYYYC